MTAEPPLLYLDHWALRRLSEDATLGNRFLAAFRRRGTVMFSLMNVEEIDASPARLVEGRTRHGVRPFPSSQASIENSLNMIVTFAPFFGFPFLWWR